MKLETIEPFIAGIGPSDVQALQYALRSADSGTLTNIREHFSPWPGKKARANVVQSLALLAPLEIESMFVEKTWLAANARNLLVVKFGLNEHMRSLLQRTQLWRQSFGPWEDLVLFRRGKLILWSCTHDQDLVVSGSESWLQSHGLQPRRSELMSVEVQYVEGEAVNDIRKSLATFVCNRAG